MFETRVLSGMRPTGALHLGHYHGVLKNWVKLQSEYPCLYFVADWHALTTDYEKPGALQAVGTDMVIDWLACGVDPNQATIFVQSLVPEHAELHLLLSMITPLGWLERVPTYKDQQEKLADRDLSTYGFLGYPLLQSADILIYQAGFVPVGQDQVAHVELTREVARRNRERRKQRAQPPVGRLGQRAQPAASGRQVFDVTGAGDTVLATLALAVAAGASLPEAAVLANTAAGVVVGKLGTATVTPAELLAALRSP